MSLLEFQNVSFEIEDKSILKNISLCIYLGDFISIVGPSGSGKSTFLKLCNNLISPTSGSIIFNGKNYLDYFPIDLRKNITFCSQTPYLFGNTVIENIEFPYFIRNVKPNFARIYSLFSIFQIPRDYIKKDVNSLSGGEKQRIALIRNLLFIPKVLLLDEITSSVDADNASIIETFIASLNNEGTTILWVTHNPEQIRKYANKVLIINSGKIISFEELSK